MLTRRTTLSARRLAAVGSDAYRATWMGKRAVFTSYDGTRSVGTIDRFTADGMYPCVTFPDGTWARLDHEVEIEQCGCEHEAHDGPSFAGCEHDAGAQRAQHVGAICDGCARDHLADYLATDAQ